MKSAMSRMLVSALFGFIFGGLIILLFMNDTVKEYILGARLIEDYFIYIFSITWLLGVITTVNGMLKSKSILNRSSREKISDELDEWVNRTYYSAQDNATIGLLLGLLTMFVTVTGVVMTEDQNTILVLGMIILAALLLFFTVYVTFYNAGILPKIYPERNIPSINDKDYSTKIFQVSDEGERHLILKGLYKSNQSTQVNIILGVLILMFVSIATETNQLLAITIMLAIFGLNSLSYTSALKKEV